MLVVLACFVGIYMFSWLGLVCPLGWVEEMELIFWVMGVFLVDSIRFYIESSNEL